MGQLSIFAEKLLKYFRIYKVNPTVYEQKLPRKAQRRGVFAASLQELVSYESAYGYFTL